MPLGTSVNHQIWILDPPLHNLAPPYFVCIYIVHNALMVTTGTVQPPPSQPCFTLLLFIPHWVFRPQRGIIKLLMSVRASVRPSVARDTSEMAGPILTKSYSKVNIYPGIVPVLSEFQNFYFWQNYAIFCAPGVTLFILDWKISVTAAWIAM